MTRDRAESPRWLNLISYLVPRGHRAEWVEEWTCELEVLTDARRLETPGTPGLVEFAMGAVPHALWMRTEGWTMDSFIQDLKYSVRGMRLSPGFSFVAAVTLALGIGANASIFSLMNGVLFRAPAGIDNPDRIVQIARSYTQAPRWDNFSSPALKLIGEEARTLSGVAGHQGQNFVLGRGAEVEQVVGEIVTGNYFEVLGVRPFLGRLLGPEDDVTPGAHPVAVISHGLWTRRFGEDPDVIGQTISIASAPYQVIGVAPRGFSGAETIGSEPVLWIPTAQHPGFRGELPFDQWGLSWINAIGRLRDGVSFEEAEASMAVVTDRLRAASSVNRDIEVLITQGVGLDPQGQLEAKQMGLLLALIVGVVLLLTCTNVANLFLARANSRRTEMGIRLALGAGRGRLARQHFTESLALAAVGTLMAVPVVLSTDRFIPLIFPYDLNVSVGADARVFLFLAGVGVLAGILFGAVPAWATSRRDVHHTLRESASTAGQSKTRLRDVLVVSQLGLSLGLVAGAALLGRSVMNAHLADPGFDSAGLMVGSIDLAATGRYDGQSGRAAMDRLVASVLDQPGVANATFSNSAPIVGGHSRSTVHPAERPDVAFEAEYNVVGPNYFETLGIPILRGRGLGGLEDETERSVVVNEALATMFWPGEDPVGKELNSAPSWRVVGLVADVQMRSLREAGRPGVYYPFSQSYSANNVLHVRGVASSLPSTDALRDGVTAVDPELPIRPVALTDGIVGSMSETRTIGALVGVFAALALTLAAVGLYGLVSYGASQRVREMGIRMALGAKPESLVRLILAKGLGVAILGVGVGLAVSWGLGQAIGSLLFGVEPFDPVTLSLASISLLATAAFAAWLPARRASRIDAAVSLRDA